MTTTARLLSVNVGAVRPLAIDRGVSAIDKRPVDHPVSVTAPDAQGVSGVSGDHICEVEHHGGPIQAVYAYAREDLDRWERDLGRPLPSGSFGENLTTAGVDLSEVEVGERWRIGPDLVLQATVPRIPCRTFAVWLDEQGWVKTFTERAVPGAYFSVLEPGSISAGDEITVLRRPGHGLTIGMVFRAKTLEPELLPRLLDVDDLPQVHRDRARARLGV